MKVYPLSKKIKFEAKNMAFGFTTITLTLLCFNLFDGEELKTRIELLNRFFDDLGFLFTVAFVLFYTFCVAFSVPNAGVMTLVAGYLYGPWQGAIVAYVSALIGASWLFFMVKNGFQSRIIKKAKAHPKFAELNFAINRHSIRFLLFLRLFPLFPFWLVNLAPIILEVRFKIFFLTSSLGILPGALIISNFGNKIREISETDLHLRSLFSGDPVFLFLVSAIAVMIIFPVFWRIRGRVKKPLPFKK